MAAAALLYLRLWAVCLAAAALLHLRLRAVCLAAAALLHLRLRAVCLAVAALLHPQGMRRLRWRSWIVAPMSRLWIGTGRRR